jgi:hypothetical protein
MPSVSLEKGGTPSMSIRLLDFTVILAAALPIGCGNSSSELATSAGGGSSGGGTSARPTETVATTLGAHPELHYITAGSTSTDTLLAFLGDNVSCDTPDPDAIDLDCNQWRWVVALSIPPPFQHVGSFALNTTISGERAQLSFGTCGLSGSSVSGTVTVQSLDASTVALHLDSKLTSETSFPLDVNGDYTFTRCP